MKMPASSSASSSSHGGCRECCSNCPICDQQNLISCTPIEALPGYQDQQRLPLPPLPRERGRSRAAVRGQPQRPQYQPQPNTVFCSPVLLSTCQPADSSEGHHKWRPRPRRRSASARQRASVVRQPSILIQQPRNEMMDNCPLCQPRYSKSPERLRQARPQQPPHPPTMVNPENRPQLRHKISYGDLLSAKRQAPVLQQRNKARVRRSRSEFRPQLNNDENNINPLNWHHNHHSKDYNGNCKDTEYAELSEKKAAKSKRKVSRSKSRGPNTNGLMTIWPGKAGIWLPQ